MRLRLRGIPHARPSLDYRLYVHSWRSIAASHPKNRSTTLDRRVAPMFFPQTIDHFNACGRKNVGRRSRRKIPQGPPRKQEHDP